MWSNSIRLVVAFGLSFLVLTGQAFAQENGGETDSQWAPSATFMVGKFDTQQFTVLSDGIGELFGYDLDMRGRSWDIGAARGRPGHSYFRISYAQVLIEDGSSATDGFTEYVTHDAVIKGVKAEKVWRIGPTRWVAAPMVSLHGGIGKVSGMVTKYREDFVFNPATRQYELAQFPPEERSIVEVFDGREWLPIFGVGIGATATLLEHLTVTVSVWGIEFPGAYKGQVQFAYWPR